jgi:hypothetical protein
MTPNELGSETAASEDGDLSQKSLFFFLPPMNAPHLSIETRKCQP